MYCGQRLCTCFPYTTLFRSHRAADRPFEGGDRGARRAVRHRDAAPGLERHVDTLLARRRHRSEEHTSELQSLRHLVCRLLLEKKKKNMLRHPLIDVKTPYSQ